MDVLGAVINTRLGDRVVRAALAVLVRAAVDGEHTTGAALLHLRVDDVLTDLLDAHERAGWRRVTVLRGQCHGGGTGGHHGDRRQRGDQAELPPVGYAVCHTSSSAMPCMIRSTYYAPFRINHECRVTSSQEIQPR
ncbi:hypothetical protein [Lentzea albidocapillata]|uniref:hypothetical protein n=1 Tax=Lentzea albidocapillata TaxID=40571 RepID=UPI00069065E4